MAWHAQFPSAASTSKAKPIQAWWLQWHAHLKAGLYHVPVLVSDHNA